MSECPSWPRELKQTRPRRLVLAAVEGAELPLTAAQVEDCLRREGSPVPLSTIYRVLDAFVAHGMLTKTDVLESGVAVYEPAGRSHQHYAVCVECHKMIPLAGCPLEHQTPHPVEEDFLVTGHRLQMFGHCGHCRKLGRGDQKQG